MQETPNKLYTYEDYLKIDNDNRYELIGGELVLVPAPRTAHQRVSTNLVYAILDFIRKNKLGELFHAPTDVLLDEPANKNTFQPDIFFVGKDRFKIIEEQRINGAPDLVIEILSPSTSKYDRVRKSKMYYTHGVKEYWIVDPDAKVIEVFTPGEKNWNLAEAYDTDGILTSPLLPGLQINLTDVF